MQVTLYAYSVMRPWETEPNLTITNIDMRGIEDYHYLSEHVVELDVEPPDRATIVQQQVAALRKEQGKHQAAITALDSRISELLSLEHQEEAA